MNALHVPSVPLADATSAAAEYSAVDDPQELAQIARRIDAPDGTARLEGLFIVDGVHCAACVLTIENALRGTDAVVDVNVASRRARIVWNPETVPLSGLLQRIAAHGYAPRPIPLDAVAAIDVRRRRASLWRLLVSVLCMMQVMMYALPRYLGDDSMSASSRALLQWAEAMLTAPVLIFAAGPFFRGAWRDVRARAIGMDVPIALGIGISVIASAAGSVTGEAVWFDSVTMFVALLWVGRWIDGRARDSASSGLAASMARMPTLVTRLGDDGSTQRVSRRVLAPGDHIAVPVGEAVPADGMLVRGSTRVDESMLTGEALALARQPGDVLRSGSLNVGAPLVMRVDRTASESTMAEVQRLIDRAAASRPQMLRSADRWSGRFLGGVLLLAALSAAVWAFIDPSRAPWVAASVLVVTCPCALALAAPSALLAAMGGLSRRGILVQSMDTLETLARVDLALLDKTGTLTQSTPVIGRVELIAPQARTVPTARSWLDRGTESGADVASDDMASDGTSPVAASDVDDAAGSKRLVLGAAAALERHALHPVARAIVQAALAMNAPVTAWIVESMTLRPTGGIDGMLLLDEGMTSSATHTERLHRVSLGPSGDVIEMRIDGPVVNARAHLHLLETLRPESPATVAGLRALDIELWIASGDAASRVDAAARACGIQVARSAMSADDKRQWLERQQPDHTVLMVGDGVNDAPVLRQADVSASLVSAAPLARHQAGVLLLNDRLDSLVTAVATARQAMRIVRQGLVLSIMYNAIGVPLAATGWLTPWMAGLGMAMSSLTVVLLALRAASPPAVAHRSAPAGGARHGRVRPGPMPGAASNAPGDHHRTDRFDRPTREP